MLFTVLKFYLSFILFSDISLNSFLSITHFPIFSLLGSSTFSFSHFSYVPLLAHVCFSAYCLSCTKLMPEAQKKPNQKRMGTHFRKKTSVISRSFMTTSNGVMFNTNI